MKIFLRRGTICWDFKLGILVEITSKSKGGRDAMVSPIWGEGERWIEFGHTAYNRDWLYVNTYLSPVWVDLPTRKKKISKNPIYQFHDEDSFCVEIAINQAFLRTKEYICFN